MLEMARDELRHALYYLKQAGSDPALAEFSKRQQERYRQIEAAINATPTRGITG